jgi:hypothetical protein
VALSFAGEDRQYVEQVAADLKTRGIRVFYDRFEEANLWGKNLYTHLHDVYRSKAHFTVVFVSKNYATKPWTNHERESAQARAFTEHGEYILPARFDDTEIPGVAPTVGYVNLASRSPHELADLICEKLAHAGFRPSTAPADQSVPHDIMDIEFVSPFGPNPVALEFLFQSFLDAAAGVVRTAAFSMAKPTAPEREQLRLAVTSLDVRMDVHEHVRTVAELAEVLLDETRNYRKSTSRFRDLAPDYVAENLRSLTSALRRYNELRVAIPRRLPYIWLGLFDYAGPFPGGTLRTHADYLRCSALALYHEIAKIVRQFDSEFTANSPYDTSHFAASRWEHNLHLIDGIQEDLAVAYVDGIGTNRIDEICIYSPVSLAQEAYAQSFERGVIISPWFMRYCVPQVELLLAHQGSNVLMTYAEVASIRKVVTLSGKELGPF